MFLLIKIADGAKAFFRKAFGAFESLRDACKEEKLDRARDLRFVISQSCRFLKPLSLFSIGACKLSARPALYQRFRTRNALALDAVRC